MLTTLTLLLLQTPGLPPLPARAYQPRVFEPGLDGGSRNSFHIGEFTPDGRLLIAFRRYPDPAYPTRFLNALTASVTDPERIMASSGHLDRFYTPIPASVDPQPFGSEFAFGGYDSVSPEYVKIHWGYELIPCTGAPCIQPCGSFAGNVKLDPDFPTPDENGSGHMTVALRPTAHGINPYPSLPDGTYSLSGTYQTYELWIVRTHSAGFTSHVCNSGPNGPLVVPAPGLTPMAVFTSQNVRVTLESSTQTITSTSVEPHQILHTVTGLEVDGIEPSITADGRLILYHGNGANTQASPGTGIVTYVYNANPCVANGWTPPRPITQLPDASELGMSVEEFKRRYRLFAQPVRMPRSAMSGAGVIGNPYLPGENVIGTYPWVSKDGSFWNAYSVRGTDAYESTGALSTKTKCAAYVCGDLTNGTIKHIDDPGINPTRHGGPWRWPWYRNFANNGYPNSWGAMSMTTGETPGQWEFLFGKDTPIPGIPADSRVPVMPLLVPTMDTYGEIRFEEADGNYLLYLACNESLAVDPGPDVTPVNRAFLIDPSTTPDSAGGASTALCTLNAGAAFPQEVHRNSLPSHVQPPPPETLDQVASRNLREAIGSVLLSPAGPFHENVGFKGQGIVLNPTGNIELSGAGRIGGLDTFSVQMFVKSVSGTLAPAGQTTKLLEYGLIVQGAKNPLFQLELDESGHFNAHLFVNVNPTVALNVSTRVSAIQPSSLLADPTAGWRHVAVTFEANGAASQLRIYLDGNLEDTDEYGTSLAVPNFPAIAHYYVVGPGRSTPAAVKLDNMSLVIDEVAVSKVRRTEVEIRRDAFVEPKPDPFGPWPQALPLTGGLDRDDARWPVDTTYDAEIELLGQQLFTSTTLSASASNPTVSGNRSCSSCHQIGAEFTGSPLQFPVDHTGAVLPPFNTPTLLNAAFGDHKTFSGSAASLEDQIVIPLTSGSEMGPQTMQHVVDRVRNDSALDFASVFGAPADQQKIAKALAMYLRLQTTGNTAFDDGSLSASAKHGRELFFGKARCFSCHRGSNFSDDEFHNIRTVAVLSAVEGRGGVTDRANEIGSLKTPTLRNVQFTGPYFHDGSRATLAEVLQHYNDPFVGSGANAKGVTDRTLRPLGLSTQELDDLEEFLEALSDHP
jgi:cytochrome c peroxidase